MPVLFISWPKCKSSLCNRSVFLLVAWQVFFLWDFHMQEDEFLAYSSTLPSISFFTKRGSWMISSFFEWHDLDLSLQGSSNPSLYLSTWILLAYFTPEKPRGNLAVLIFWPEYIKSTSQRNEKEEDPQMKRLGFALRFGTMEFIRPMAHHPSWLFWGTTLHLDWLPKGNPAFVASSYKSGLPRQT